MNELETTIIEFNLKTRELKTIALKEFELDQINSNIIYWIHCDLSQKNDLVILSKLINLPEEIINLCNKSDRIPKLINFDESLVVQMESLLLTPFKSKAIIDFENIFFLLTNKYCFTASEATLPALYEFKKTCQKSVKYAKTPCFILFLIMDNIVNDYARILFEFEMVTEKLNLTIYTEHKTIYKKVMNFKQQVLKVKRYIIASREILTRLSGRNIAVISDACRTSLSNLANHTHMIVHEADSIRDMLNSMLDQIDNNLMQRMNHTIRILTIFASIFLPLTLITGIYGMNFAWMPELHWQYGYFYALALIFIVALLLISIFRKML